MNPLELLALGGVEIGEEQTHLHRSPRSLPQMHRRFNWRALRPSERPRGAGGLGEAVFCSHAWVEASPSASFEQVFFFPQVWWPVPGSDQIDMPTQLEIAMNIMIRIFHQYSCKEGDRFKLNKGELKMLLQQELTEFLSVSGSLHMQG